MRTAKTLIRLIWVFSGRTCHFVGFVVMRLIIINVICIVTALDLKKDLLVINCS